MFDRFQQRVPRIRAKKGVDGLEIVDICVENEEPSRMGALDDSLSVMNKDSVEVHLAIPSFHEEAYRA